MQRRIRQHLAAALGVILLGAGCASGGGAAGDGRESRPTRGSANVITENEINGAGRQFANALEIIESLRPAMLRSRGSNSAGNSGAGDIVAYIGDVRLGSIQELRSVVAQEVREIRFVPANDATTRWGTGHASGAIQVLRKR